jgi:organic radical activating enzyme
MLEPQELKKGCLRIKAIQSLVHPEKLALSKSKDFDRLIMFRPTGVCNYRCKYCHWREQSHYKLIDVLDTITTIQKTFPKESIYYYFHGGEATTSSYLLPIISHINSFPKTKIELQTNASKNVDYFKWLEDWVKVDCYSISYHFEQCQDFKSFLDVVAYIYSLGKLENLDVMFPTTPLSNYLAEFKNNVRQLLKYGKHIEVTYGYGCGFKEDADHLLDFYMELEPVIHEAEYEVTLRNDKKIILNKSELFSIGVDCFGMKCSAMNKYMAINGNGDYAPCGSYLIRGNVDRARVHNLLKNPNSFRVKSRFGTTCEEHYCSGEWYLGQHYE